MTLWQVLLLVVLVAVLAGMGVVIGWSIWGDPQCDAWGEHPHIGGLTQCRLPRGHLIGHQFEDATALSETATIEHGGLLAAFRPDPARDLPDDAFAPKPLTATEAASASSD